MSKDPFFIAKGSLQGLGYTSVESSLFKKINFNSLLLKCLSSDVFAVLLFVILIEFLFIDFISYSFFAETESDSTRIQKALFQILITIPFSVFTYMYVQWNLGRTYSLTKENSFKAFFLKNFIEWSITNLRVFARVIMFTFLLIIPGIIESMRLCFSSYNVLFNKNMDDETFDPVIDSRKRIEPFSHDVFLLFIFSMLIPIFLTLPFGEKTFMEEPLMRVFSAVSVCVSIIVSQTYIFYKFSNYYTYDELCLTNKEIKGEKV